MNTENKPESWDLRLYINGMTPTARKTLANLKEICAEHLPEQCNIEIIDLREQPEAAARDKIIAIPTLVRKLPRPLRKIIGDLSDREKVLVGLEIRPGA